MNGSLLAAAKRIPANLFKHAASFHRTHFAMDALSLAAFEERAAAAEERLRVLEAAVLQGGAKVDTSALEDLKQLLLKAREETAKLQEERDQAVAEASKLRYQVLHLKRAVEEGDRKLAAATKA